MTAIETGWRGFSDIDGSWNTACTSRRYAAECGDRIGDLGAVEADGAARRLEQPQDGSAGGRLSRSGLADQPERLAGQDVEAHVLDDVRALLAEQTRVRRS